MSRLDKNPEEKIKEREELKKIFQYNRQWLSDEKSISQSFFEELKDAFFKAEVDTKSIEEIKKYRNRPIPSYVKGSLFDTPKSMELKKQLQYQLFGVNILPEMLKLNNHCIVTDFQRYSKCNDDNLYRPLIGFFTTTENARKLKYLDNQRFSYEYVSIEYSSIEFAEKKTNEKFERSRFKEFKYNNKSKNFLNFLYQEKDNKFKKYLIPTHLNFDDYNQNKLNSINRVKREIDDLKRQAIRESGKKLESTQDFINTLERYERYERSGSLEQNQINAKEIIERLIPKLEELTIRENSIAEASIKNYMDMESDYYYKQAFLNLRKQIDSKTNVKIDLTEWSYCLVFQTTWCDESFEPYKEINEAVKIFQPRATKEENRYRDQARLSAFNSKISSNDIDVNLISYLTQVFEQPPTRQQDLFLQVGDLDSFDRLSKTFKKYPEGGHWIKKIEKDGRKYIERVVGPYEKEVAMREAKILKNILTLEDAKVARVFSFKELVCEDKLLEINLEMDVNNYVKPKYRFHVPPGAKLFCLANKFTDIVYFEKEKLTDEIVKYSNYAYNKGIKYLSTFDHLIFYIPDDPTSLRKTGELKMLLKQKEEKYIKPDEFIWMLDAIMGRKEKRGKEPDELPFKISEEINKNGIVTYDQIKEIHSLISNLECGEEKNFLSFDKFKERFQPDFVEVYRNSDYQIQTEINMNVVINEKDEKPKKVKIIKDFNNKYSITMKRRRKRFEDINLTSVDIKGCLGYLKINFNNLKDKTWDISKLELFSGDDFFNQEIVLIVFMLFLSKCFGVKTIILDDNLRKSDCHNDVMYHYYHLFYLAYGNFKKFEEIGFVVNNYKEYENVIDRVKNKSVLQLINENNLEIKVNPNIANMSVSEFAKSFIESDKCFSKGNLIVINQISALIHSRVSLQIFNDLDEKGFDFFENYISY